MLDCAPIEPKSEIPLIHYPYGEKMVEQPGGGFFVATVSYCALYIKEEYAYSYVPDEITCDSCRRRAKID
jgi:hypothetical protein